MDTNFLEHIPIEEVSNHVFDILVTHAPLEKTNLGTFQRQDGEIIVELTVPLGYSIKNGFLNDCVNINNDGSGTSAFASQDTTKKKRKNKESKKALSTKSTRSKNKSTQHNSNGQQYTFLELCVSQSMSLFTSNSESSTTGAMLWKVSVLFCEWILNISQGYIIDKYIEPSHDSENEENAEENKDNLESPVNIFKYSLNEWDVVELGCGSAGLVCSALGPITNSYIATDHLSALVKTCERNVVANVPEKFIFSNTVNRQPSEEQERGTDERKIRFMEFDWEDKKYGLENISQALEREKDNTDISDTLSAQVQSLEINKQAPDTQTYTESETHNANSSNDSNTKDKNTNKKMNPTRPLVVVACDTIYNEHLIPYFLSAAKSVCELRPDNSHILIAQQVRDSDIMESFMEQFVGFEHQNKNSETEETRNVFDVYAVPNNLLSKQLVQGYTIHYGKFNS